MKEQIIKIIFESINELNKSLENKISIEEASKMPLFGSKSALDSLDLVNLIVSVEAAVEDKFDVSITIADERALSQKHSPFRTVGTLVDYIKMLLEEKLNDN